MNNTPQEEARPLKVCYFGTYRVNYSRNQIMISGLRANGVEVIECHETLWRGIDDRVEQAGGGWLRPRFWLRIISAYWNLWRKHSKAGEYDVMMLGYPGQLDAYLGRLLSWWRRRPMVLDLYMSLYLIAEERGLIEKSPLTGRLIKLLEGIGLRLANLLIADTKEYLAYHLQTYGLKPEKFKLVPAGADDRIFYPRPELTPPTDYFRVIYYGTFIPNHGVPTMIQAADRLKEHPEIRFDFYGDGPERPLAENLTAELGLDNTHLHGWIEKDKIPEEIARSHLCLGAFGTTKQSMMTIQNKIWECMAVGRPVITGDAPAIQSVMKNQAEIYLVERENPEALEVSILELKSNATFREGIALAGYERSKNNTILALGYLTKNTLASIL